MGKQEGSQVPVSIFLQPIAPPYILGLYAFAGGAAVVGVGLAGWYGTTGAALYAWPFVAFFGGLAQFVAAMWAYRARNGLATAIFGLWGSLWLAYGLLQWLFAAGVLPRPPFGVLPELGVWFMVVAWVTAVGAYAATAFSWVLTGTLGLATVAMGVAAAGEFGARALLVPAGWLLVITAGGRLVHGQRAAPAVDLPAAGPPRLADAPEPAGAGGGARLRRARGAAWLGTRRRTSTCSRWRRRESSPSIAFLPQSC